MVDSEENLTLFNSLQASQSQDRSSMSITCQSLPPFQHPSHNSFEYDLEVDYKSNEKASMVYSALVVDKELQPDKVKRKMSVSNGKLSVHIEAVEARFLRASYSAFVDVLTLATKTIEEFGQGIKL